MSNNIDTKERMSRSNIYSIFGKLIGSQIDSNEDGEVLLKKAGLSSFWENYGNKLSSYRYNRGGIKTEMIVTIQSMLVLLFVRRLKLMKKYCCVF